MRACKGWYVLLTCLTDISGGEPGWWLGTCVRIVVQRLEQSAGAVVCRQVLPAYWFGDWHWASAHVLCLVGAVLGSIGSFAWQAHANSVTEGGAPTWLVRLLPC